MFIEVSPIATAHNLRSAVSDDFWGDVVTEIELLPHIPTESLDGIEGFSHLEIIFHFSQADEGKIVYSGNPRENPTWPKVGIFAQRKKDRPNRLGLITVELIRRE